ncbi:MAG: TIGR00153 family protein [Candidatus Helarchaeota archaeon]
MGSLFEWFRSRKEAKIIKKTREHAKRVHDTIDELKNVTIAIKNKEFDKVKIGVKRIDEIEKECDDIRRDIMITLSKGELTPNVREDLAHLVKRLDDIANHANAAGRRLNIIEDLQILTPISDKMIEMMEITILAVEKTQKLVDELLKEDGSTMVETIHEVGKLEHQVDTINYAIKRDLQKLDYSNISPFTATIVYEMINRMESISDSAEDVADLIRILYFERV